MNFNNMNYNNINLNNMNIINLSDIYLNDKSCSDLYGHSFIQGIFDDKKLGDEEIYAEEQFKDMSIIAEDNDLDENFIQKEDEACYFLNEYQLSNESNNNNSNIFGNIEKLSFNFNHLFNDNYKSACY